MLEISMEKTILNFLF